MYLFIFIVFLITVKIYPSTFLLFYMSADVPVHHYTCLVYLFIFGLTCTMAFQLVYLHTDLPEIKYTCLPSCFSSVQPQRPTCHHSYLCTCPHLHPFMTLPVHFQTFIPIKLLRSTHQRLCCSTCPQMYLFITTPVQFSSSFSA